MKSKSPNRIKVQVPVKPHLAKYVASQLQSSNGALYVDATSAIGKFFYAMVEKGRPKSYDGCTLTLMLPEADRHGQTYDGRSESLMINETNIARVNSFLDYMFRKELFARLDLLQERGEVQRKSGKVKQEIINFMVRYDITDADLTMDALKKSYYRYRKCGMKLNKEVF
jgi:hypothetical protein